MTTFSIELMLVLRFFKLISVLALATGTVGAFVPKALEDAQRFAYTLAGPGFGATWVLGFVMAYGGDVSLLSTWILVAACCSLVSINVVLFSIGREGRRGKTTALLACGLLAVSLAMMVWKPV
jgi:hypothetical protein